MPGDGGNMTKTLQESIAAAMDCEDVELVAYLPYILQDFHEIGSSAESLTKIVQENNRAEIPRIIDLGCGKGATIIEIAQHVKSDCLGIDGIESFIIYAIEQAEKRGLENCRFEVGDIRRIENIQGQYDFIILGSIGPVYGDYYSTMETLSPMLTEEGIIILDDGYLDSNSSSEQALVGTRKELVDQLRLARMEIFREYLGDEICDRDDYGKQYQDIKRRCQELMLKYPNKRGLFERYILKQEKEYRNLEENIICSTILIRKSMA